ncbi:hypothetical protein BH10PSE11_BH10PSE11_38590 [soil metagenome]
MFQLFLRARARNHFQARSAGRDAETDQTRITGISDAIDQALTAAEVEQAGLKGRLDDVLARAAVTFGNESDEYLTRESLDSHHQDLFDTEISNAQRRLKELSANIGHFKFLKTVLVTRFPDFKPEPPKLS